MDETKANASEESRFQCALAAIDDANNQDPNREISDGREYPKERLYSERMTAWLDRLAPDAGEALKLAVRAQHIRRWAIPRNTYPMDRDGYHRWRTELGRFHAETVGAIMRACGYDEEAIERVGALVRKERFKADAQAQTLEDVACLVFLENYFADFALRQDEEKLMPIIARTWKKMSERGHQAALSLSLSEECRNLLKRALFDADLAR